MLWLFQSDLTINVRSPRMEVAAAPTIVKAVGAMSTIAFIKSCLSMIYILSRI
jgi:hypothetical protein